MQMSKTAEQYFEALIKESKKAHDLAMEARKKGYDPANTVEISLAKNMAERVVGLISVLAPQLVGSGVVERIIELEEKYGALDWRISLIIALELAQEKFCKFKDEKEAIEIGIRTGFAYSTVGVVSSPLDGLIGIDIKERRDGKGKYFCLNYAGPIRNAGGTNAAVSVLISDYVRKKLGYATYDPDENEIKRVYVEVQDYHERITNLQYNPSEEELHFLAQKIPVEISGDPSEKISVSNYKDLPRIKTDQIRSGFCLIMSSCIPLKAPKLWKQIQKWGTEFDMDHWNFLEELLKIQKKAKSQGAKVAAAAKITPDFTFITDLVAGRPVLSHPLAKGGFRLRYGRSRVSGYSAQSIHPATMQILNDYIALGTQLKIERPGKGTILSSCDTIQGPIVKLLNGNVLLLNTESEAKQIKKEVAAILFLGDVLINYGDFFNRAHILCPAGYCEEWWVQELEQSIVTTFGSLDLEKTSELTAISPERLSILTKEFFKIKPEISEAITLSKNLGVPLHPHYTFHWADLSMEELEQALRMMYASKITKDEEITKIIIKNNPENKYLLEILGVPHIIATEFIVIEQGFAAALAISISLETNELEKALNLLNDSTKQDSKQKTSLEIINQLSKIKIRDKSGTYIGGRMGRPEKAKMRQLTGSPHGLFPIGDEGGRMRSFQAALAAKKVTGDFVLFYCDTCKTETVFPKCEVCENQTRKLRYCQKCKKMMQTDQCQIHGSCSVYNRREIDIQKYFDICLKKINIQVYPDLIKGVRGTSNKEHIPEHLAKTILRAKNNVYVNKDGTIRFDCTEMPCTHFKSKEIGTPIEKLIELGYNFDIHGKPLISDNQILEIKPQDVILPAPSKSTDEPSDQVMFRVTKFIDELLVNLYGLKPYYNLKIPSELIGHLIIGLAPHTSAGMIGRIIGFSKMQVFLCHPYYHAASRRDCDGDEIGFMLLMDAFLNFSRKYLSESRGSTMDAPLVLTSVLAPSEVDDMVFDMDIVWKYPLEFYEAALNYKLPWDVKIRQIKNVLNTPQQYEEMGFTHDTENFNNGILCSAYKTIPTMEDKLKGQMDLAEKIRAVDAADVARLVIEKHLLKDTRGNLRKFSMQQFRCVNCNEKFRRPPLIGTCTKCKNGKIIFTISEGSVIKYLEPSISLAKKYGVSPYLKQSLELTKMRVESVFGKEQEKQLGLGAWFG